MITHQGSVALLRDPVAQTLLHSRIPARLAYIATDGTPRLVPMWFHWTGEELCMGTPFDAPKVASIQAEPHIAVTIDSDEWPSTSLTLRGEASLEIVEGLSPHYAEAAQRYLGKEQGAAWATQVQAILPRMAYISLRPTWAGVIDFQTRFPSAIAKRMH
jgi:hypothetical protein